MEQVLQNINRLNRNMEGIVAVRAPLSIIHYAYPDMRIKSAN